METRKKKREEIIMGENRILLLGAYVKKLMTCNAYKKMMCSGSIHLVYAPRQLWTLKPLVIRVDAKPQSGPSRAACQLLLQRAHAPTDQQAGGALARALASAVIGTGCPIVASRGRIPPISYGTESIPPATPGTGTSGTLRPGGNRSCSTPATLTLGLLTLLDHWHKEIWHRTSPRTHSRNKLLLIVELRVRHVGVQVTNVKRSRQELIADDATGSNNRGSGGGGCHTAGTRRCCQSVGSHRRTLMLHLNLSHTEIAIRFLSSSVPSPPIRSTIIINDKRRN
nr:hypothetical protein Iba_chr01aCG17990 [Ipomoea batatas]